MSQRAGRIERHSQEFDSSRILFRDRSFFHPQQMRAAESGDFQNDRVAALRLACITGGEDHARLQVDIAAVKIAEQLCHFLFQCGYIGSVICYKIVFVIHPTPQLAFVFFNNHKYFLSFIIIRFPCVITIFDNGFSFCISDFGSS